MTRLVFVGGTVFDGHRYAGPRTVLVEDGRVAAVLDASEVPSGEQVDLDGGLLAPGFVDAHVHAVWGGLERLRCDLSDLHEPTAYLQRIAAYAAAHPDLTWLQGGGWSMADFPGGSPSAQDLDTVVADRPVFLPNRDHHGAWVNSRALELAGIDPTTPDPSDGRIERDERGRPTGTLHEGAMSLVARHCPDTTAAELDAGLLEGQRHLHSLGITGWQDAILGDYAGSTDPSTAYFRAARSGRLTASVVGALWWERDRDEDQVAELVRRRDALSHGRFRATTVKIMQDGVVENGTAAMTAPYLDRDGR